MATPPVPSSSPWSFELSWSSSPLSRKSLISSQSFRSHTNGLFIYHYFLTVSIHDIDSDITSHENFLSTSPRSHIFRPIALTCLASALFERNLLLNQREDLDKSIFRCTESILLPSPSRLEHGQRIFQTLFLLTSALFERSRVSEQPEDAIHAAKFLHHLRDQPLVAVGIPRHAVTTLLIDSLALQVELGARDVMQNIEEMAVLCKELLTTDASDCDATRSITLFSTVVRSKISLRFQNQPLDQVIECLRVAREHKPDLREACITLAFMLSHRYLTTYGNDDYEEATSIFDELITSSSPGEIQDNFSDIAQEYVTSLAILRSVTHETPEYSEEAIFRARSFVASSSDKDTKLIHSALLFDLEHNGEQRQRNFGSIEGLQASSSRSHLPVAEIPFRETTLFRILSTIRDNIANIDEAIELGRSVLPSSTQRDKDTSFPLFLFGTILFEAFRRTNKIEHLNESINTYRQALERPTSQAERFTTHRRLSMSLLTRSERFPGHRTQDLDEGLKLLSQFVKDEHVNLPDRFQSACVWASVARRDRHSSVSTAYGCAVSLMQDTLLFAPTLQLQHTTLATSEDTHSMPLDYASYQVDLGQLQEAIETLEKGRALLWSEMRHLRASIDQISKADPDLGRKFAAVNRDLEELTKSIPPSHKVSVDDGAVDGLRAVDPFGRFLLKQRGLLKERDKLISQIQGLPGFDSFLASPSFDTLRSSASSGPVIIINHSSWRSDILILLHDRPPSLVPTPHDFYDHASGLKEKLLDSRHKSGLGSNHYQEALASVLADLYQLVGKPVIDRLRHLKVPEQSRIWWCPTSVFCSLPLHAMGPIPSDDGEMRYFMDIYICSYTPTLSALIQSRNRAFGSQSSDRPSLLLIAQPDPSLPTVQGEIQVVQALDTKVTSLISEAATPATVVDGFHHHRFAHFACHGTLEPGKPFEAGFELHGGERLTLLKIVRSHLPTAEFAFLSACHTAELTEGSMVDEGLHLAAAMQYCGFRSVVGTMWAMVDEDGQELAEHFYKALFSTARREEGIPYHERSAKALRFAVKKLRRKRYITLERWVNFVHYGA